MFVFHLGSGTHRLDFTMSLTFAQLAVAGIAVWLAFKIVRGLYFSPLAKVPGPKFAAVTYLDEFYHQAIRNDWGTYLKSLHQRYGK